MDSWITELHRTFYTVNLWLTVVFSVYSNQNTCYNYLVQIQTFPGMYQPNETTQLRAVMIIMESLLQKYICTCHMFKHNDMRMLNTYKLLLFLNCTAKVKQMNQFLQVTSDILF